MGRHGRVTAARKNRGNTQLPVRPTPGRNDAMAGGCPANWEETNMKLVLRWIGPLVVAVMLSGPAFAAASVPTARVTQTSTAPARPVSTAPLAGTTTSDA